jgi:hypothetical protein
MLKFVNCLKVRKRDFGLVLFLTRHESVIQSFILAWSFYCVDDAWSMTWCRLWGCNDLYVGVWWASVAVIQFRYVVHQKVERCFLFCVTCMWNESNHPPFFPIYSYNRHQVWRDCVAQNSRSEQIMSCPWVHKSRRLIFVRCRVITWA